jgi:hypothetical protein
MPVTLFASTVHKLMNAENTSTPAIFGSSHQIAFIVDSLESSRIVLLNRDHGLMHCSKIRHSCPLVPEGFHVNAPRENHPPQLSLADLIGLPSS